MARRQSTGSGDIVDFRHVPGADDVAPRCRTMFYHVDGVLDLVNRPALAVGPFAPLHAVNWPQVTPLLGKRVISRDFFNKRFHADAPLLAVNLWNILTGFFQIILIRPFVPDMHAILRQIFNVAGALEKPQQFVRHAGKVQFLGSHRRKPVRQIIPRLHAKHFRRADASPVAFFHAIITDMLQGV